MANLQSRTLVAVIWIDWYPYHVARFLGLASNTELAGRVAGIELVGGIGVHAGLKFREDLPVGLPVETLLPQSSWRDANKLSLAFKLWRKLTELEPAVVLVPGYYTLPGIAAAVWARVHGATSVLMTESTSYDHARTALKERLKSIGLHMLFDWAISGGRAHVEYLRQLGFRSDRIVGSYDVVDNELFRKGVEAVRTHAVPSADAPTSPYFLYVGRLGEEKNVDGLLRAWIAYRDAGGVWPLVLVGDGPKAEPLREIAQASPYSPDVFFPGLKSSHALMPFYASAGCFVLPSAREPWGLVVNEAMAAGLPVLVSDRCGCAPDLVAAGENGFLFNPLDLSALTALLHLVAALPQADREAMGRRSEEIIAAFSPEGFGRSVESIVAESRNVSASPVTAHKPQLTPSAEARR